MTTEPFTAKAPSEVVVLGLGFARLLLADEAITAATCWVEDQEGTPQPDMVEGVADLTGAPWVRHTVKGGVNGTTYRFCAQVTTDKGRTLVGSSTLPVRRGA